MQKISEFLGCNVQRVINDISGLIFNISFNPKGQINKGVILANIDPEKKEFKPETEININNNFSVIKQKFNTLPLPKKNQLMKLKNLSVRKLKLFKKIRIVLFKQLWLEL